MLKASAPRADTRCHAGWSSTKLGADVPTSGMVTGWLRSPYMCQRLRDAGSTETWVKPQFPLTTLVPRPPGDSVLYQVHI